MLQDVKRSQLTRIASSPPVMSERLKEEILEWSVTDEEKVLGTVPEKLDEEK